MRNFLHAGLDSSGAWKEKAWECSREPGQIGRTQWYSFLLGGESSPLHFPETGNSLTSGLLGCKQQEPCVKGPGHSKRQVREGVSKVCEKGPDLPGCAMLGHWPSLCWVFTESPDLFSLFASSVKNCVT